MNITTTINGRTYNNDTSRKLKGLNTPGAFGQSGNGSRRLTRTIKAERVNVNHGCNCHTYAPPEQFKSRNGRMYGRYSTGQIVRLNP